MFSSNNAKVLVVDDEVYIREIISRWLAKDGYECLTAENGEKALKILEENNIAIMISDIMMPGISGLELLALAKEKYDDLAVIMATAVDDRQVGTQALELGAYGYVIKPLDRNEILINVANGLHLRKLEIENRRHRQELENLVQERTLELQQTIHKLQETEKELSIAQEETIQRLAMAAEFRDDETAFHTVRMGNYCQILATRLGLQPSEVELIRTSSPLHDVGKIGTPDNILLKPGKLTPEEFEIIKEHTVIGHRLLSNSKSIMLEKAAVIAWTHHEKFDGSGYPRGLSGEDIPLTGRVAAICDVFDALTSDRVYKKAYSIDKALSIILEGRGKHFDPVISDLFMDSMDEISAVHNEYKDK